MISPMGLFFVVLIFAPFLFIMAAAFIYHGLRSIWRRVRNEED